ncbi:SOS response-associated peptidase [Paenibacillus sp. HN-1]|uniref:SOS response-associated peptidase n=1 Tax=Paenibacillus TaxID=44249 RepID=UPI001CAA1DA2|nr:MULTISPECIES: SOS response-associated peptidase [Paenibacillus]MBY9078430.1 SOS response-associated peptidase [Paenibacillus sp. CGMCC 1.18879]MBY9087920.1 SOS response-associated peptidase [Paenibacillus sinensis]
MCGRYTITVSIEELMLRYYTNDVTIIHYAPKYNAAPGQMIPAVIGSGHGNRIGALRWGLIPSWIDRAQTGKPLINIRADTLGAKPAFRRLLSSRRCIIPADGFYEWMTTSSGKQPMRIVMNDGSIFSLAGIYDIWLDEKGDKQAACSVVTTEANQLMQEIHHRMPVILRPEDEAAWLDRDNQNADNLVHMLRPYDAQRMRAYAVSPKVGNVRNDTKDLLEEA